MATTILAFQATSDSVECGLFSPTTILDYLQENKKLASKNLISMIDLLLTRNSISLADITLCAINQGPSFFTTLRTVLATANGLCAPLSLARVGISGLDACVYEYSHKNIPTTLFLLDACSHDVYYALILPGESLTGCARFTTLCSYIQEKIGLTTPLFCTGSGTIVYKTALHDYFGTNALIPEPIVPSVSLATIADLAYQQYSKNPQGYRDPVMPLYIKNHPVPVPVIP